MSHKIDKLIAAALLETNAMTLVCHLGNDAGIRRIEFKDYWVARERLLWEPNGRYRHRLTNPLRAGPPSPQTMFPEAYYTALEWLEAHRDVLQECVCADWNYPAKRNQYLPGNEVGLVVDLSDALKDVVGDQVDPVLVSAVLFRLGLDQFCADYKTTPHPSLATKRERRAAQWCVSRSVLATTV